MRPKYFSFKKILVVYLLSLLSLQSLVVNAEGGMEDNDLNLQVERFEGDIKDSATASLENAHILFDLPTSQSIEKMKQEEKIAQKEFQKMLFLTEYVTFENKTSDLTFSSINETSFLETNRPAQNELAVKNSDDSLKQYFIISSCICLFLGSLISYRLIYRVKRDKKELDNE